MFELYLQHGYRLPEEEPKYYLVRFWRGEPLTYPDICLTTNYPNIIPIPKNVEVKLTKNIKLFSIVYKIIQ